jgi:hypothetical protein
MIRPSGEEGAQHAGRGTLANCGATSQRDDVGRTASRATEERVSHATKTARHSDMEIQEARERQVNVHYFIERDRLVQPAECGLTLMKPTLKCGTSSAFSFYSARHFKSRLPISITTEISQCRRPARLPTGCGARSTS